MCAAQHQSLATQALALIKDWPDWELRKIFKII